MSAGQGATCTVFSVPDAPQPRLPAPERLHELLDEVLGHAVREIAGADSAVRPEQRRLAHDILDTMLAHGHLSGQAPTGSGKSLAGLAPAMLLSALGAQRSVFSTESLRLQRQYLEKDAPVVARAVAAVTGRPVPTMAVLKGRSNYVCAAKIASFLSTASGLEVAEPDELAGASWRGTDLFESGALKTLVLWGKDQIADGEPGEKDARPADTGEQWRQVSVSSEECAGSRCAFFDLCRAEAARRAAAGSDVVVTNHSLLALQAVTGAPIVMGGVAGDFGHLVVDEAHALPGSVRSHGTTSLGAVTLVRAVSAVKSLVEPSAERDQLINPADDLALELDGMLEALLCGESLRVLRTGDRELDGLCERIVQWAARALDQLPEVPETSTQGQLKLKRAATALTNIIDTASPKSTAPGYARWIEAGDASVGSGAALLTSQADTAERLARTYAGALAEDEPALAVVAISATLPETATGDLGILGPHHVYASPFAGAYAASAAGVPRPARNAGLFSGRGMDLERHREWAAEMVARLVEAAGGSALVLAATTRSALCYRDALSPVSEALGIELYSQWDGVGDVVGAWREDERSVLVGTKGLMTGVDAAGATCRLVIIDRVPRAPANPLDDARCALLRSRSQMNGYEAQAAVYGGDAALLLAQAAGRLIRSGGDCGAVVVLDPRLLKGTPSAYPDAVRRLYSAPLASFGSKLDDPDAVCELLKRDRLRAARPDEALPLAG